MEKDNEEKKLEGWNKLLKEKCKIPERFRLIDTEKPKGKNYKKYFLVFLGILVLSGVIYYLGINDKFISNINETMVCEADTLNCPTAVCPNIPSCPTCPACNCNFPSNLNIDLEIVNETE